MEVKATISTGWRIRLGAMAVIFVFVSAYFLYDGFVGYPAQKQIYNQFALFEKEHKDDESDWLEQWNKQATETGLPDADSPRALDSYNHSESDILTQKVIGFVLTPLAALMLYAWVQTFFRWIKMDEKGLSTHNGQTAPFDAISKLDKTRWYKCIANVHYKENELDMKLVLDDWKYDRQTIDTIVRTIEEHLTDEQIVGDIRETDRDKKKAQKQQEAQQGEQSKEKSTPPSETDEAEASTESSPEESADAVEQTAGAKDTAERNV